MNTNVRVIIFGGDDECLNIVLPGNPIDESLRPSKKRRAWGATQSVPHPFLIFGVNNESDLISHDDT